MTICPCNKTKPFATCCEPFLQGKATPKTPSELMRSRFSAYAQKKEHYLLDTWHSSTRPQTIDMHQTPQWINLQIINTSTTEQHGIVEFKATYITQNNIAVLHETSRFIQENQRWFYIDGDLHETPKDKQGRNSPCPCGSGRKFKKCCGK